MTGKMKAVLLGAVALVGLYAVFGGQTPFGGEVFRHEGFMDETGIKDRLKQLGIS